MGGDMAKQKYCVDCGTEISRRAPRCRSCAAKAAWARGDFGEECRRKKSEASKAAWARGDFGEEWRRKNSESTKAQWARGAYDSEETRRKKSESTKACWARGDMDGVFTEEWCRKNSESTKAAHARGAYDGVFQSPTSIEIQIAAALDTICIEHESQYRPEGYSRIFDEFVPPNTLLEIQGDYWHGPERPDNQERDAEKATWAAENGYELIVIWEHEIKERGARSIIAEAFA